MSATILTGDCRQILPTMEAESVQCIVTSPPYWRLRRYTDNPLEIGQEPTPAAYVEALRAVFAECRRALKSDGVLWLNLGDTYSANRTYQVPSTKGGSKHGGVQGRSGGMNAAEIGLPAKNLIGLPWRVAFALQDDGWILRSELIWEKPNAMPESVTDRPTRSHEHLFLFARSPRYYYDAKAIAEPSVRPGDVQTFGGNKGRAYKPERDDPNFRNGSEQWGRTVTCAETRNARTVWAIPTSPIADEHYAPMPQALAERCIKAGSRPGDTVLDPFAGSGTTLCAAGKLGRLPIGIDIGFQEIQERRLDKTQLEALYDQPD